MLPGIEKETGQVTGINKISNRYFYPGSLVARILQAKYFPNSSFLQANRGLLIFGVAYGKELLLKGLRWRVGDGASIDIWEDQWIPFGTTFRVSTINRHLLPQGRVAQLIDPDSSTWKISLLQQLFLPHEIEAIRGMPLSASRPSDKLIWHYTPFS